MKQSATILIYTLYLMNSLFAAPDSIDLSGGWRFALDQDDKGLQEQWYQAELSGNDTLSLPGSMQQQGYGNDPGPSTSWVGDIRESEWNKPKYAPYRSADNFKMPFWLQPEKYYKGPAWYRKTVTIPESWKGKQISLTLERPHWQTRVWIDSKDCGSVNHLSVPHIYDLSESLSPGQHTLTIRVDNRVIVNVGPNSHSISDHTQSNWNGVVGKIELRAKPEVWIEDVQVYPDTANRSVNVNVALGNHLDKSISGELNTDIVFDDNSVAASTQKVTVESGGNSVNFVIPLGDTIQPWDEFNPNLYTLKMQLQTEHRADQNQIVFGMRDVTTRGSRILLNGHPVFMRGTLECCIFPKTGYPPTDVASWKRIINVCKAHGLNHIRFHSWCPPEAAFIAADELGFYYQVECSSWPNQGVSIGDGKPLDAWLYNEADAILKANGNHPSFLLLACGNEPAGPEQGAVYLRKWISHYQQTDPRRLITGGSGWPMIEESNYHVTPEPRIQQWGQQLKSRINSKSPETVTDYRDFVHRYPDHPVIAHEIGQWCVYPNFDEIKKYKGILKPKNFEVFRDFLKQKGMADQAHDFLMASGKLQTLCYKEEIESALRTAGFGGFQLLDLHDFPGQGTALVGVLDPFWDSKPYVSPAEYKRFCGPVVPLARMPKRIFTASDTLTAQVDVSQFGPIDLNNVELQWKLLNTDGKPVRQGVLKADKLPAGDLYTVGDLSIPLSDLKTPAKYTLQLAIQEADALNNWDVWVYPDSVDTCAGDIIITSAQDEDAVTKLQDGAKVLLAIKPKQVKTNVEIGFSSIFWNTAWTDGQAPQTLGILCDPKHPALAQFPTEYHSNWQWSEPIQHAAAMVLDDLPAQLRPIVQVVPDWFEPKRLGLVFEAKVGTGSLLVCSVDISGDLDNQPARRQLRYSLLAYMESEKFKPETEVDIESIKAFFRDLTPMEQLGARVIRVDSFEPGHKGDSAIDNNPKTLWHTAWTGGKPAPPHEIQLDLGKPVDVKGITYLPRQDGNQNGWIQEYAVYVSDTPDTWGRPVASGIFQKDTSLKTIQFKHEITTRYIRFEAIRGFDDDVFTSIAELGLIDK